MVEGDVCLIILEVYHDTVEKQLRGIIRQTPIFLNLSINTIHTYYLTHLKAAPRGSTLREHATFLYNGSGFLSDIMCFLEAQNQREFEYSALPEIST